jgi:hypothetical protein
MCVSWSRIECCRRFSSTRFVLLPTGPLNAQTRVTTPLGNDAIYRILFYIPPWHALDYNIIKVAVLEYLDTLDGPMPHKNPEVRREYDRKRRELRRLLKTDPKAAEVRAKELEAEKIARRNQVKDSPKQETASAPQPTTRRKKLRNPDAESRKKFNENRARGKRTCGEEACTTVLSVYNTEDYCAIHAPARNRDSKIFV